MCLGTLADWLVAVGTLVLAAVAVFQETIRGWFYRPKFKVSVKTEPPDCVSVPFGPLPNGLMVDAVYLRLWVENIGNATALNAEVYAHELSRKRTDGSWDRITSFPPMNLVWGNANGAIYFPRISPQMGKHCDLAHITDPARRNLIEEDSPKVSAQETSLAFDLAARPNHKGHIVGPGDYKLIIRVAAENATPIKKTVIISLRGMWYPDETTMLRDGIGVTVSE